MEAIEYYAAIEGDGDERHHYFQEKLRRLLSNEKVHNQMQKDGQKEQPKPVLKEQNEGGTSHRFNHKKQMELNLMMGERKAQELTKELLKNVNASFQIDNLIKKNLSVQEEEIAKRYSSFI
jgi:hypothetical protein